MSDSEFLKYFIWANIFAIGAMFVIYHLLVVLPPILG